MYIYHTKPTIYQFLDQKQYLRKIHIYFPLSEVYLNVFDNISRNCTYQRIQLAIKAYEVLILEFIYNKK